MRITVPTGARLQNIEAFAKKVSEPDDPGLELILPETYFAVHPMVVSAIAAAGLRALDSGAGVSVPAIPETRSVRYLERMGLFSLLNAETPLSVSEHEAAGRFVPLRVIKDSKSLSDFIVDLVPLLHTSPEQAEPVQYVMAELVRNTIEHSGLKPRAVVMAQVFPNSGAVGIGVADTGRGIMSSLAPAHATNTDLEAIQLAMRPGITGKTRRLGGTSENAGAGLFFCKSLAYISKHYFVVYSGHGLFKLLLRRDDDPHLIKVRPQRDRATRHAELPSWPGTIVGLDLGTDVYKSFSRFMQLMRENYDFDVKVQKKSKNRKNARFR